MSTDELHKEIDLIQACIARMASNSFQLKGWCVALISVVLALSDKSLGVLVMSVIVLIPILCFWYLDAFFLRTEKMYRKMYVWVLEKRAAGDTEKQYDLNPLRFSSQVDGFGSVMFSRTLGVFYGIPALLALVLIVVSLLRSLGVLK